jgi:hypothetical protein
MTDKDNKEEITPVVRVDDGLKVAPKGQLHENPNQNITTLSTDPAISELDQNANVYAKSEQRDAAIEVAQGADSQDEQVDEKNKNQGDAGNANVNPEHKMDDKPYSVFTHNEKKIIVLCAGLSQFFSPISGQIYFPSLDAIAADLRVSNSLVNLTITTYLVSALAISYQGPNPLTDVARSCKVSHLHSSVGFLIVQDEDQPTLSVSSFISPPISAWVFKITMPH